MNRRRVMVIGVGLAALMAAACTHPTPVTTPAAAPPRPAPGAAVQLAPDPPRPYDGHVRFLSNWLPPVGTNLAAPDPTASFTNAQMLTMDCEDPAAAVDALRLRANIDGRPIILHSGLMGWGNEGYQVAGTLTECWALERAFIADFRPRVLEVHTSDEPPDVAWSHWVDGGTRYDPNRYNRDLSIICSTVHADFPDLPCAVNYGSVPDGLQIAAGLNHVWLETYDPDWHAKLDKLAGLTSLPLALMPPGFVMGDPAALDARQAAIVQAEWTEAQANPRITSLVFYLWCCDDLATGDRNFYTVSGGRVPLTLAALQAVGQQIRNSR